VQRLWRRVLDLLLRTLAPEPGAVFRLSSARANLLFEAAQHLIAFFASQQPTLCSRSKLEVRPRIMLPRYNWLSGYMVFKGAMSNTMLVLWMLRQPTSTLIGLYHRLSLAQLDGEGMPAPFDPNRWCSPESSRETVRARGDSVSSVQSSVSSVDADTSVDVAMFTSYNGSSLSPALSQRYAAILAPFVLIHQVHFCHLVRPGSLIHVWVAQGLGACCPDSTVRPSHGCSASFVRSRSCCSPNETNNDGTMIASFLLFYHG
jgi:hypothetical protein